MCNLDRGAAASVEVMVPECFLRSVSVIANEEHLVLCCMTCRYSSVPANPDKSSWNAK